MFRCVLDNTGRDYLTDELADAKAHRYGVDVMGDSSNLVSDIDWWDGVEIDEPQFDDPNGDPGDWGDESIDEYDLRHTIEERARDWLKERDLALRIARDTAIDDLPF